MPMLQPSSGRAVGRPPTAIDKREKNLKWKVSKLVAQTGRASSLHLAEKAGVKRSKVADEQAEAQLKALMVPCPIAGHLGVGTDSLVEHALRRRANGIRRCFTTARSCRRPSSWRSSTSVAVLRRV
jgi:hypothetical protein